MCKCANYDVSRSNFDGIHPIVYAAVILKDSAFLWTDGRYLLQASKQCDESVWTVKQSMPKGMTIGEHLSTILPPDSKVSKAQPWTWHLNARHAVTNWSDQSYGIQVFPVRDDTRGSDSARCTGGDRCVSGTPQHGQDYGNQAQGKRSPACRSRLKPHRPDLDRQVKLQCLSKRCCVSATLSGGKICI